MKNYGQITEDKDIINKKYADTLNASSLHKSGDEVAEGQKTFNGKVLIKNLTLNTERPWTFEQNNSGANATLDLKSEFDGKMFRITSPLKTKGISIAQSEAGEKEDNDNILITDDEEGNEVQFEFLDLVELDDEEYVVLLPVTEEGEEEEGEVVILKLEDTDEDSEEESYVGVEDEEILNKVFAIFKEKYKDEFNFVDED